MFLDIKLVTLLISLIGLLTTQSGYARSKKHRMLARHVESNEITTKDKFGAVKLIKTTSENCQKMMKGLVKDIKTLSKYSSAQVLQNISEGQKAILNFKMNDCNDKLRRHEMFKLASNAIRDHDRVVAVLLPLSTFTTAHAQSVKLGMQKGSGLSDSEFAKKFVFIDTHGNTLGTNQAVAKAYFQHNASLIVGGLSQVEAKIIADWSRRILVTSLVTHYDPKVVAKNKRSFLVFPNLENLYVGIKEAMKNQNLKKIAILFPTSPVNAEMMNQFAVKMENAGIQVTHKASYNPDDYQSMETAAKKIFEIDTGIRRAEYNRIYRRLRRRARRAGAKFNSRLVSLPPIVNMEAVYIADNFRSVRYMAKIFNFLGVDKMRLFGNQQWRAKSLVDPWDPFLDGAYFVDYVGSYASLPQGLGVMHSNLFASPSQAQHIDFKLIGYLAGHVASKSIKSQVSSRAQMHSYVKNMSIDEKMFFGKRKVFLKDRSTNWPYFKFMVGSKTVQLTH